MLSAAFKSLQNLKAWLRFASQRLQSSHEAWEINENFSYLLYSFSCSVELRDTITVCHWILGIRLWLVWTVVYVVTFAETY